jgi:hypothetical protein
MRTCRPARGPTVASCAGVTPSPRWPRLLHPQWWTLEGRPAQTPVAYDPTGPGNQQPGPGMQARDRRTAAGPGGGNALEWGASAPPPPPFPPVEPAPATTTDSGGHPEQTPEAGHWARFPVLIATLASLEHKSMLLRVMGGVSLPDINAAVRLTSTARRPAEHHTLDVLRPSATAHDPPLATRVPVVLLPHTATEPTDIPPTPRRAARANGINHDQFPRHHRVHSDATTPVIAARQWHDAELAMKLARHSFERWFTASDQDTPSLAIIHAHHTRTALHEAARAITTLINTLDTEEPELITTPARDTNGVDAFGEAGAGEAG